ncbi:uncharacterized protein I303_106270 [Kwoniella dejecticola CBS 10117]|uniref:Prefoldin, alpha subunit n=1 Tax=Kwoniella dejecticola CBS 10117 TaxID=1296121 RepID=A0AAJ8KUD6_9TREE
MTTTPASLTSAHTERAPIYCAHLQTSLLPELVTTRRALAGVESDISEYENLSVKIDELEKVKGKSIETLTEMGAGVWIEATIPDSSYITLDLGYDIHLDLSLTEAREYIVRKIEVLKKKGDNLSKKEEFLVWQVGQFQGALSQS